MCGLIKVLLSIFWSLSVICVHDLYLCVCLSLSVSVIQPIKKNLVTHHKIILLKLTCYFKKKGKKK